MDSIIQTETGSEWHTSHGAKGYVFVVTDGKEKHIHQSGIKLIDQDWINISGGKHGKWCRAEYEVPDGTILKLFAISTYRGRPNEGGGAYFIANSRSPRIRAFGGTYSGRGGEISGHLQKIELEDLPNYGITVEPKQKKYYRAGIKVLIGE